ncbi:cytochrome P450 [Sphingomicrobium clamense]|uniref:Cytochrome P450 n=1 Tax=Sphingomicrobium clamense TaxID=2851013 RepID=A0ABS6V9I4_9SPHN|nr:cytochrome P450 [Sphingomicrobium sp. B8]MBW0145807.1 cytochrome P450 [Sphingomicrobium sp. B8]
MTAFVPPKPPTNPKKLNPLVRFFKSFNCSIRPLYERSYKMKMGDVRLPGRTMYFVNQPELVNEILQADVDRFPKSDLMSTMLELILGQSIFNSNGDLWRQQRRMMDPAFDITRIKSIFPLMREAADAMAQRFDEGAAGPDTAIDLEMTHVTADVIFRTIYSQPFSREDAEAIFENFEHFQQLAWLHGVWSLAGVPHWLSVGKWRAKKYAARIRELLHRPVRQRLAAIQQGEEIPEGDLLTSFIRARDPETGKVFTEEELVDQIGIMFLAGHETSASALAWALYLIANVPEVQERMQAEADAVFADGPIEFAKMKRLGFTRDVFREALRLYPPVTFVPRDAAQPEHMRKKDILPGAILFVSPWLMHRHVDHWDDPDVFDPGRYKRKETKESERKAYLPFSKGPRVCLGAAFALQEAVIILATIMRDWTVNPVEGHVPKPISRLTLRSENGIRLQMERRR